MPHAQQQVLNAVQAAIVAAATDAGARVFVDRVDPLEPGELPAVMIDEGEDGEVVVKATLSGHEQVRRLAVQVTCVVKGAAAAAAARELGLQVEKALENDANLPELCAAGGYVIESSKQANSGDGDRLLSGRVQTWRFGYGVQTASPDTIN